MHLFIIGVLVGFILFPVGKALIVKLMNKVNNNDDK